jgi:hypothetical protein
VTHQVALAVKLSKEAFQKLNHIELVEKLTAGIVSGTGVSAKKVTVVIEHISLEGKFSGFPGCTKGINHTQIIEGFAGTMSLPKSALTIHYCDSSYTHTSPSGSRRLEESVTYTVKIVNSGNNEAVNKAQVAMASISAENLKKQLFESGFDTATLSLKEEATPSVEVKTKAIVEDNAVPDVKEVESGVNTETGGTTVVQSVNANVVATTTTGKGITTTIADKDDYESDWAVTPMISIWSVLYAMALS